MSIKKAILILSCLLAGVVNAANSQLEDSYRFLVSDRAVGGVLYPATAGKLNGSALPLSFVDSPQYWGAYVCTQKEPCAVMDVYNPYTYTLTAQLNTAGELQTERVNVHGGSNIYDAATWQIAVMLGYVINHFDIPADGKAYALASAQNNLLKLGYNGNASEPLQNANRAATVGERFIYNGHVIGDIDHAYAFRMIPRSWVSVDPFQGTRYQSLLSMSRLIKEEPNYQLGSVTWTDWKPITGENAWAFLIGPLQAAYLQYMRNEHHQYIPFDEPAIQNALAVLPTFAAMQSRIGAVYYAPAGTVGNQGDQLVNPHQVSVENNVSLYAGLKILDATLHAELTYNKNLSESQKTTINTALSTIRIMIEGGQVAGTDPTEGLLRFFQKYAWRDNEFVQAGLANDPHQKDVWMAVTKPKAIDANTWGIAALGAKQIDRWFGFGASYKNWQQIKRWGGYGVGNTLWGVGYSDADGNGADPNGRYRQGVLSSEWTAGAINMVRNLIAHYQKTPNTSADYKASTEYVRSLKQDESAMLDALQKLRIDNYINEDFPGKPASYQDLMHQQLKPFLYSSKRYFVPFGWYANPLPSTCATAWAIMLADHFDPFGYGGQPN